MLGYIIKSDFVKRLSLLAVMVTLGFNVCVYLQGWPSTTQSVILMSHHHHERLLLQHRRLVRSRSANGTRNVTVGELAPWFRMNISERLSMLKYRNVTTALPPPLPCASCKKPWCLDCLRKEDLKFYESCLTSTRYVFRKVPEGEMQGGCGFIDGRKRAAVGLVSFPGSGDTWLRQLLETATGICTGSIHCDASPRRSGMNGEGVHSGAVLVTYTHFLDNVTWTKPNKPKSVRIPNHPTNKRHPAYGSAILLVRNPYDAIVAEYTKYVYKNRLKKMDLEMEQAKFGKNENWNKFVEFYLPQWGDYFPLWLLVEGAGHDHPVHVVKFEDLKSNTSLEVGKILDFLGFPFNEEELTRKLNGTLSDALQREHYSDFDHYTQNQRHLINATISSTIDYLRTNYKSTLDLENYLWHG